MDEDVPAPPKMNRTVRTLGTVVFAVGLLSFVGWLALDDPARERAPRRRSYAP